MKSQLNHKQGRPCFSLLLLFVHQGKHFRPSGTSGLAHDQLGNFSIHADPFPLPVDLEILGIGAESRGWQNGIGSAAWIGSDLISALILMEGKVTLLLVGAYGTWDEVIGCLI